MDANINDPVAATDPRQDDYDIWLGAVTLDRWIKWNRHGTSNVLYLDGHAKSVNKPDAYMGMYPGGVVLTNSDRIKPINTRGFRRSICP
jgi:prepilin-type processing-associated H-X9-DG protein